MIDQREIKNIQDKLLLILKDIDGVCKTHDIKYTLYAGTLIGAVRHQGFIPWDDDADIAFTRSEFEKFIKIYRQKKNKDIEIDENFWVTKIKLKEEESESNTENNFVDIFIFDNLPENNLQIKIKMFVIKTLQGMLKEVKNKKNYRLDQRILITATGLLGKLFSRKQKLEMYTKVSVWGNEKKTQYKCVYNTGFSYLDRYFISDCVQNYIECDFESETFLILEDYHHILETLYGDYMTLPPEEERVPSH